MSPTLDQPYRRFIAVGRKVLRLSAPALLAVTVLTVVASVPAGAYAPRITKPEPLRRLLQTAISGGAAVSWTARFLTAVPP